MKHKKTFALLLLPFLLAFTSIFLQPKNVQAAVGCGFSPTSVAVGETVGIIVTDLPGINTAKLYTYGSEITLGNINGGAGVPSTGGNTFTIPSSALAPEYQVRVVTSFGGEITCSGGNLTVTGITTGTPTCNGFFDCLSGVASPTNQFNANGLVGNLISRLLPIIYVFLGFITIIIIVISGIQFIASNGNPESAAGARGRLTYAIIGLVVIILAYAITQIVNSIFLKAPGF